MKHGPRPKRSKGTWYVSFEPNERLPGQIRKTETFRNQQDAKAFAKAKLADGSKYQRGHVQSVSTEADHHVSSDT
jgi:hypothetical protein